MGYYTDGTAYYDIIERSCEMCHVHGSDSQTTNLNSNQLKKLQNRLDALDREKLELMRNNALCNQEKLSSSALLENCKEKLQTELDACSQLQTKCNGDLAKVTLERDTLKEKGAELSICNTNLRDVTQERDDCKVELGQSKNDFAKDLEQLRGKNQQQGSEIITLKEQIGGLVATNKTLTNSFKACSDDLAQSINTILLTL